MSVDLDSFRANGYVVVPSQIPEALLDDAQIAALLEGEAAPPDAAIAVVAEYEEDIAALAAAPWRLQGGELPLVEPATFAWQAYLQAPAARQCSNS